MIKEKTDKMIEDLMLVTEKGNVYSRVINDTEKALIEKTLKRSFGNQSIASKILGINRNTLRMKIKRLNIDVKKFRI